MRLKDIEARNAEALNMIQNNPEGFDYADNSQIAYFGYYEVDMFECPTFLMFTNNDCPRGWDIMFSRHFEPQSMKLWCRMARAATGIIDIGAHVGVYSLAAAALRDDVKIHSFEPNPYAFSRLRMHKTINSFSNINEYAFAISDEIGTTYLSWAKKPTLQISSGGSINARPASDEVERALIQTTILNGSGLAATLGEHPLMKIDVEGAESKTFGGITEILALKPDIILETFSRRSCDAINEIVEPLGYSVYQIFEKEGSVELLDRLRPCKIDENGNFNQLLTTRPPPEIANLAK
jgi:FkbM family methyltransferase